jgi:hypothetical protein
MWRLRHVVVLLLIVGGGAEQSFAGALHIWTGRVDNRWSVRGNWHDNVAPLPGDQLIFGDPYYHATPTTTVNDCPAGMYFSGLSFAYEGGWKLTGNPASVGSLGTYPVTDGVLNEVAFDVGVVSRDGSQPPILGIQGNLVISGSLTGSGNIVVEPDSLIRLTGGGPFQGRMDVNEFFVGAVPGVTKPGDIAIDGSLPHLTLVVWRGAVIGSGAVEFLRLAKGATLYRPNELPGEPLSHLHATAVDQDCPPQGCPLPPVYADVRDVPIYFEVRDPDHYATLETTGKVMLQNFWPQIVSGPDVPPGLQLTIIRSGGLAELVTRQNGVPRYMQWTGRYPWLVDEGANSGRDMVITRRTWPGSFQGPHSKMADLLWRNEVTGANAVWVLEGGEHPERLVRVVDLPSLPNTDYRVAGTADFDGDGNGDILWWNRTTGAMALWLMNAVELRSIVDLPGIPDTFIQPVTVGDFNFDGKPEIVFHNLRTGAVSLWLMNGASFGSIVNMSFGVDPGQFRICGVMNTAGATGILLQSGRQLGFFWTIRYNQESPYIDLGTLAPGEEVGGSACLDVRNDRSNWVIRNPQTGTARIDSMALPPVPNPDWHIVGPR